MKTPGQRGYSMKARAEAAENSSKDILRVLGELWIEHPLHAITLDMIAKRAGLTVRTILRKYGSKEGLFRAALKGDPAGIQAIKDKAETGNLDMAVALLMEEYELTGKAGIRTLAIEHQLPLAADILAKGRELHKAWCARVFSPYLPAKTDKRYPVHLGAFYAATDIYNWKVLRLDLGYTADETAKIFLRTLKGLVKIIKKTK